MRAILICLIVILSACVPKSKPQSVIEKTDTSLLIKKKEPSLSEIMDSLQLKKEALRISIDKSGYKL